MRAWSISVATIVSPTSLVTIAPSSACRCSWGRDCRWDPRWPPHQSARLAVDAARLELVAQIGSTYTESRQALGRAGNLVEVTRSAEEVQASYTRQYLSGRRSWLDVMNAVREVVQADLQKADVTAMSIADGRKLLLWAYGIDRLH